MDKAVAERRLRELELAGKGRSLTAAEWGEAIDLLRQLGRNDQADKLQNRLREGAAPAPAPVTEPSEVPAGEAAPPVLKRPVPPWLVLLVLGVLFAPFFVLLGRADGDKRREDSRRVQPVAVTHAVGYRVAGTCGRATVTYVTPTGGTEQHDVGLPWQSDQWRIDGNVHLYISAQKATTYGDVTVSVVVDGRDTKAASSTAAYGIAATSASVPE